MTRSTTTWIALPAIAAGIAVACGMYTVQLCACVHPFGVFIGTSYPLRLPDTAIHQRLLAKIPDGMSRGEAEGALRRSLGEGYGRYCRAVKAGGETITCEFVLEEDLFGAREKGMVLTVILDPLGKVSSLGTSRFTRFAWN